jgi:hypothetical protein
MPNLFFSYTCESNGCISHATLLYCAKLLLHFYISAYFCQCQWHIGDLAHKLWEDSALAHTIIDLLKDQQDKLHLVHVVVECELFIAR